MTWLRLARLTRSTRTSLIALTRAPTTGARAELVLELQARRARFSEPPALLDALEARAVVRRHRSRPTGVAVVLQLTEGAAPIDEPPPTEDAAPIDEPPPTEDAAPIDEPPPTEGAAPIDGPPPTEGSAACE